MAAGVSGPRQGEKKPRSPCRLTRLSTTGSKSQEKACDSARCGTHGSITNDVLRITTLMADKATYTRSGEKQEQKHRKPPVT